MISLERARQNMNVAIENMLPKVMEDIESHINTACSKGESRIVFHVETTGIAKRVEDELNKIGYKVDWHPSTGSVEMIISWA